MSPPRVRWERRRERNLASDPWPSRSGGNHDNEADDRRGTRGSDYGGDRGPRRVRGHPCHAAACEPGRRGSAAGRRGACPGREPRGRARTDAPGDPPAQGHGEHRSRLRSAGASIRRVAARDRRPAFGGPLGRGVPDPGDGRARRRASDRQGAVVLLPAQAHGIERARDRTSASPTSRTRGCGTRARARTSRWTHRCGAIRPTVSSSPRTSGARASRTWSTAGCWSREATWRSAPRPRPRRA